MSDHIHALTTALIPLTTLVSFSIYLGIHPDSPIHKLVRRPIRLPIHHDEALDGSIPTEKDPFDIVDPVVCIDGIPVDPEKFWASMWRRKLALFITMSLPFISNITLLILTAASGVEPQERDRQIVIPALLIPAHCVILLIGWWHLSQHTVSTHWPTTIIQSINIFSAFLVLSALALLPTTPLPSQPSGILQALLPILHFPPLLIACYIRRGPPLHLPLDALYPSKVLEAVPPLHESLDPSKPNVSEEVQVTVPEWLLFSYTTNLVRKGYYAESMDVWDLPILTSDMRTLPNYTAMKKEYGQRSRRLGNWEGFNLLWQLAKVNKGTLIAQSLLAAITAVFYYLPHYVLRLFIRYLENDPSRSEPIWGWFLAFCLFVSNALIYLASGVLWSLSSVILEGRIKVQLNSLLFKKTLVKKDIASSAPDTSNKEAKKQLAKEKKLVRGKDEDDDDDSGDEDEEEGVNSKSQIMTLFTVDVDRVTEFVFHEFSLIDAPIEIIVATVFLVNMLGTSAIFGLLTVIICLPLNHIASKIVVKAQDNLMKTRDQRTSLMNEILQGIRMLKFMAWERSFEKRINDIRKQELHWQARNYQIEVSFNCIWALTPVLVTVVSFLHFTLVSHQRLTPSIAFTSIAVFAELEYALNALPETFIQALQGFVSCKRIETYLTRDEVAPVKNEVGDGDIILTNATFTWPVDDSAYKPVNGLAPRSVPATPKHAFTLADLNLKFPRGELSLICGRLGSGKTLLLAGLLGEADLVAGQVICPRSHPDAMNGHPDPILEQEWLVPNMVAFVPQQAWLQNASIKDNIIFSSPWSEARYQAVIEACSLLPDLEVLEDGDETEIGEKGLNLSGGQKARVSLARAVYSRASLLFLDDVLSAVDAHTAQAIMDNCLQGDIVAGRTILMVSHHTTLVSPGAAYIVALENGDVKFSGTRDDFVACGMMEELEAEDVKAKPTAPENKELKLPESISKPGHKSVISLSGITLASSSSSMVGGKSKPPRKLIEDEKRAKGRIAWSVWKLYLTSLGGPVWWCMFVFGITIAMIVPVAERGWVEYWTGSPGVHTAEYYVIGYALITLIGVFLKNIQYVVVYYGSLKASKKLHGVMLEAVLFAKLRFHDTTSRGRLLNRFGKDIEGLDSSMADNFVRSISYGLSATVTVCSITYVGGLPFIVVGCIVMVIYYQIGSIYGQTSRDMRRLDSVTRSPLYSLFGETVSGVAVIRAFGASTIALKQMMRLADTNLLAFAWTWTVNRWLSARFNVLSSFVVGLTAVMVLVSPGTTAAMAGFALAFANTITHDLLFVVRRFVQLEQSMVALERIKEYSELPREAPEFGDRRPPASWPEAGAISVENLTIRYAPDLPDVLHSIAFEVAPREKIGIVGSTGCGKSTLALSFFRFVEAHAGKIIIDGIDISQIGLTDLRTRVTIIPQDPTILSGTLRSTLDVFDEYDDADIYAALKRVHLLEEDSETSSGDEIRNKNVFKDLSNPVSEGGDNFSSGEKQLICMARAILRRNRVLFMDEATASIDYETDELISKTIREEFHDSTILTIAHRIHTIIDFDKVLVMDKGRLVEFSSPAELLRNPKSRFYALCKATGKTEFKNLKRMATEAERRKSPSSSSSPQKDY
ncbi:hypothetical protein TREMEDRAFT_42903 [Tremella mesenterica DSM 1558]|uniref:uncharacterized protein n=1 Tax=Tremella mesenterica (strain ATCC 24925 / CBS 8224 / DSM 1558 / NBRC 9311 / NRRL Y-6157 / RJB 2259-6 / UBC 559-6) TaxID=578456 RepID=UPI0003F49DE4|nr:uncharacterized protein TREMEDRAFT_42903 [Tremella mesenterica DSM 1558]EIW71535.1 hypothetical protein TREMEDRAFT_42903 [Tremella mesenterica DSM 1558]